MLFIIKSIRKKYQKCINKVSKKSSFSPNAFDVEVKRVSSYTTALEFAEKRKSRYSMDSNNCISGIVRTKSMEKTKVKKSLPKLEHRFSSRERDNHFKLFERADSKDHEY